MCSRRSLAFWSVFLAVILASCTRNGSPAAADSFPKAEEIPGWAPTGERMIFASDNLYDLVDGQAEAYFAYNFVQASVQNYSGPEDEFVAVEVWQLATSADAHGLYTTSIAGMPADVGVDGDLDPGQRLAFWQDRYFVRVRARQTIDEEDMLAFAQTVSGALPAGGERHELLDRLPAGGLIARSEVFFHQEISIQDQLWLGDGNPLGLGLDTDAVLAQYGTASGTAGLILTQYSSTDAAAVALAGLKGSQLGDLVAADVRDNLLGAVFGETDPEEAEALLAVALSDGDENG
jgi:hypothetical protein